MVFLRTFHLHLKAGCGVFGVKQLRTLALGQVGGVHEVGELCVIPMEADNVVLPSHLGRVQAVQLHSEVIDGAVVVGKVYRDP